MSFNGEQETIVDLCASTITVVCLRFIARRISKAGLWWDDWLTIPSAVSLFQTLFDLTGIVHI